MADQNLKILVDVDIGSAIAKLTELQNKLANLALDIEEVDAVGSEGIDIKTSLDPINDDLARLKAEMEVFEASNSLDIETNIGTEDIAGRDKLSNLAFDIEEDDAIGTEGISIKTQVESITDELARIKAKIKLFEASNSLDIETNIGTENISGRDKLSKLAHDIEEVDAVGSEGISVKTRVESIADKLARIKAEMESFEVSNSLDIETNVDTEDIGGRDKLSNLALNIKEVDAIGTEGITVKTRVESIADKLARIKAKMELFEASNSLDIESNISGNENINVKTQVGPIADELARIKAEMESFEQSEKLTISTELRKHRTTITGASAQQTIRAGSFGPNILQDDDDGRSSLASKIPNLFENLESPMKRFDLRMSDMHNLLAKLVPLILVLIGAIPALLTAVIGLAAAAASAAAALFALGGFGALGVALQGGELDMQRLTDVLSDIKDEFVEAFAPLSESLEPLFMDAVDGLAMLFDTIAAQGDALMQLTDDARAFGGFVLSFVPSALRSMAAMVETMRPVFSMMANALRDASVLRTLTSLTLDIIPAVAAMTSAIINALPALIRFSAGFASMVGLIVRAVGAFGKLLSILPVSAKALGFITAATLAAFSAFALLNSAIITTTLLKLGAWLQARIVQLVGYKAATWSATIATYGLTNALRALLAVTGIGLVLVGLSVGVSTLGSAMQSTESDIRDTTDALQEFDRVAGRTEGGFNPYAGSQAPVSGSKAATSSGNKYVLAGTDRDNRSNLKNGQWREGVTTYGGGN